MTQTPNGMHPDLARILDKERTAIAQGYQRGDVNHYLNPVIGMLRLRAHNGETITSKDVEWAIEAMTKATRAETALLAYLNPENYAMALSSPDTDTTGTNVDTACCTAGTGQGEERDHE